MRGRRSSPDARLDASRFAKDISIPAAAFTCLACTYVYTYMYICIYMCTYIYIRTYTRACTYEGYSEVTKRSRRGIPAFQGSRTIRTFSRAFNLVVEIAR